MKANAGGVLDPKAVIGRDALIETIWKHLEQKCVLLNAERRIGKTSIVRKMVAEPRSGWFGVYQDLEDVHHASEFAAAVYETIQKFLSRSTRVMNVAKKFYEDHEFGDFSKKKERPWKNLLTASIEDLVAAKHDQKLVLFWDEVPYMVDNIAKADGVQVAAEVLDTLRKLRIQHTSDLRMVLTGSIGLHHVLSQMHDAKIATEPVNDMTPIEVTPLGSIEAHKLVGLLLEGEKLSAAGPHAVADTIVQETDGFPFYIQHVVGALSMEQLPVTPESIKSLVQRRLVDAADPWELGHFRERIRIYYSNEKDARLVALALDCLCHDDIPCSLNELRNRINAQSSEFTDRSHVVHVLRLMERDHYLSRNVDGQYQFRFALIRRWWKLDRGLE